jgi:hypothetical protein
VIIQTKQATVTTRCRPFNVNEIDADTNYVEVRVKLGAIDYAIDLTDDDARELAAALNACADVVGMKNATKG